MLEKKKCIPCEGATAISPEEARALLTNVQGWTITPDGKWIEKRYALKNFVQALAFVNKVGAVAEEEGHHPDIALGWGYVHIRLQTHAAQGLHENDFILAAKIDKIQ